LQTSHQIQKELLQILSSRVRKYIRDDSNFASLLMKFMMSQKRNKWLLC